MNPHSFGCPPRRRTMPLTETTETRGKPGGGGGKPRLCWWTASNQDAFPPRNAARKLESGCTGPRGRAEAPGGVWVGELSGFRFCWRPWSWVRS